MLEIWTDYWNAIVQYDFEISWVYVKLHGIRDLMFYDFTCDYVELYIIGLRHCVELYYRINATSAASFIIVIMTPAKRVL